MRVKAALRASLGDLSGPSGYLSGFVGLENRVLREALRPAERHTARNVIVVLIVRRVRQIRRPKIEKRGERKAEQRGGEPQHRLGLSGISCVGP